MRVELAAPAKLNLSLHVTGRRPDGYHELVTRMQKIDLCDQVVIQTRGQAGIEISCDWPTVPSDHTNLAVKAASAFLQASNLGSACGLSITLNKSIPAAAGLGGGSSDGAAVLNGLNRLFDYPLTEAQLMQIGRTLGADFGFLISSHQAVVATGIGDQLRQAETVDRFHYLLVNPGIRVETKWVYDNYRLTKDSDKFILCGSQTSENAVFTLDDLHNDLEQVTMPRYPVIGRIKQQLLDEGASGALMSGSGPTVFGLFDNLEVAEAAQGSLTRRFTAQAGCTVLLTKAYTGA
jgi:4-diphosphocytidyl-2-C-methyl-D-erythritol kinase